MLLGLLLLAAACGGADQGQAGEVEAAQPSAEISDTKADHTVTLSGTVKNYGGEQITVEKVSLTEFTVVATDRGQAAPEYSFSLEVPVTDQQLFRLTVGTKQRFIVLADYDVSLVTDMQDPRDPMYLQDDKHNAWMTELYAMQSQQQQRMGQAQQEFQMALQARDEALINAKAIQMETMRNSFAEKLAAFVDAYNDKSLVALVAINSLDINNYMELYKATAAGLMKLAPQSPMVQQLHDQVTKAEQLAIGKPAPEIALPNPEGEVVPLSSLRGKVVLIDFWAGWCKPCRAENPNVVKAYNKYNDEGFEVYGVSLDRDRGLWLRAIEEDGLVWTQVSDLAYFQSEAAQTYGISAIPATYLVGRDGTIIGKNLRGQALEQKLEEIFGS